ncbi:uncharacterized protein LOC132193701 [Neocloeon triangulifer]|uniref:uncharacterized protein LOC132193701 n=1 Tax=Neocloeon triangulifer TaxID=2078957 RepID=UPI00286FADB2|nr:uncharacterized protein LOC132193701 [Neocloeon triangulifer]
MEFQSSGFTQLDQFFREYSPPITPEHHTCVGLGLELLKKLWLLESKFPGLASKFYVISCEEAIENTERYMANGPPPVQLAEKEHILLALRIMVGNRSGFLVLDPGYHVARAVTVMADKQYPHTGWFTQKDDETGVKEYNYEMDALGRYLVWRIHETNPRGQSQDNASLIYVEQPFLCAVQCTERRNLVYNFKSLLARDTKGHVIAGIYFDLTSKDKVTLFCNDDEGKKTKRKVDFGVFLKKSLATEIEELVEECAIQLGMLENDLLSLLATLATIVENQEFVEQTLSINENINKIAADN